MTRDEILKLEEGIEIDDLVAEKVMGWHREKLEGYRRAHWVDAENRYQCGVSFEGEYPDCEDLRCLIWYPSASIVWAWDVMEKLRFHLSPWQDDMWICYDRHDLNYAKITAIANTAPLAICRAALLTVKDLVNE